LIEKLQTYCKPSFSRNDGQALPVDLNTSSDGMKRDFIEKMLQELGNRGSQLTLK